MAIKINRLDTHFTPDPKRVIVRFFMPGGESRAKKIIDRVIMMSDSDTAQVLNQTLRDFSNRHRNITRIFLNHFERVSYIFNALGLNSQNISDERKLLIGAYFTHEYSIESAAFFNPSIIEDPDQSHLEDGQKRVIVSFRATGEGHVSSICFRGATLNKDCSLEFSPLGKLVDVPETVQLHEYKKEDFLVKLNDMNLSAVEALEKIMNRLNDTFIFRELLYTINEFEKNNEITVEVNKVLHAIKFIANAQYQIGFSLDTSINERVIFPVTDAESNGIEDARFVKFTDDDGEVTYYATYTAYNGFVIMPQLIETKDFYTFTVKPIYGRNAQNKGMGLFPRKVNGKYAMLSRHDGENNYVMFSDQINNWDNEAVLIQEPKFAWEFVQLGNSGSPIETSEGWLVITHGVGPVRKYVLGAILLDLNDPTKVIAQLENPLLSANETEREGYVPNVVYSCGALLHNDSIVIPYAMSDTSSGFAHVELKDIIQNMTFVDRKKVNLKNRGKRILLVEDDITTSMMLIKTLTEDGFDVDHAEDGLLALIKIGKTNYDLILSDIEMPNLNGYKLLEFIKEKAIKIPVVFLSAYVSELDEIKGLELGASEYIKKPVERNILKLRLNKILS
ncbi:response regulator [Maribacter sp. 1_MG-2023]|uniref:glycoside hydrolase family 130 protein n=1 Tax=Maribacter sp. 1_MG-2023 TaxID=3062677 RepID=UPI0026E1B63C|nr:response regulator [Maribacter sp. 1_MG-2023]MDO6472353.1 response regulator [Maribacter sp. 1_MG-2023]